MRRGWTRGWTYICGKQGGRGLGQRYDRYLEIIYLSIAPRLAVSSPEAARSWRASDRALGCLELRRASLGQSAVSGPRWPRAGRPHSRLDVHIAWRRVPPSRRGEVAGRVLVEGPAGAIGAVTRGVGPHGGRAAVLEPFVGELQPPLPRRRLAVLRSLRVAEEMRELVCACMVKGGGNGRLWNSRN